MPPGTLQTSPPTVAVWRSSIRDWRCRRLAVIVTTAFGVSSPGRLGAWPSGTFDCGPRWYASRLIVDR
jgi:hypothetical protein